MVQIRSARDTQDRNPTDKRQKVEGESLERLQTQLAGSTHKVEDY